MHNTSASSVARSLTATYLASLIPAIAAGIIATGAAPALATCNGCGNGGGNTTAYAPAGSGTIASFTMVLAGNLLSAVGIVNGNLTNMPPPGSPSSPFQPLLKPPPMILNSVKLKGGDQVIYPARFVRR